MGRIPNDIILYLPESNLLEKEREHFLVYIPWDEKYFSFIPSDFEEFFQFVLPYLHARTTDVHTAICMGYLDEFIAQSNLGSINRRVVGVALILHDNGWSLLSESEIAASLGVKGLTLTEMAMGPKEKHAMLGAQRAQMLLNQFPFLPPLSQEEKDLIVACVLYHDKPWEVAGKELPAEVQLLVDLDHIWSFTHENFWQDTVRKGIDPIQYLENLANDLDGYFVTDFGKQKAREMLDERKKEIYDLEDSSTH